MSPTLAINERVAERRRMGLATLHLGFGEAGAPVHPLLRETLQSAAHLSSYGPVDGSHALRAAVAAWFGRRGLPTDPGDIVVTPGSKAALFALMMALPGDVVLPRPSWVSYAPQALMLGKRVIWHPTPPAAGGVPDPLTLPEALWQHRRAGLDPRIVILTVPDNPTGTHPSRPVLEQLIDVAVEEGLTIIADEIYRDLSYRPADVPTAAEMAPLETFVTTGLSKALAVGGWRVGIVRVPQSDLGELTRGRVRAIASEVWSCLPTPIAVAAEVAYSEPPDLAQHVVSARGAYRALTENVHDIATRAGMTCEAPQAAFYLYPRVTPGTTRWHTDDDLAAWLLEHAGLAVLPGSAFGDDPTAMRFRLSTSLLCGEDEAERWESLRAADADRILELPRIREALDTIEAAFRAISG